MTFTIETEQRWKSVLRVPATIRTFGSAVRWLREQRRLTSRQLATAVGVSVGFVSDIEHDRRATMRVVEFALALGVDLRELEQRQGVTEDLTEWLKERPDIVRLLREIRSGRNSPTILRGKL